MDSDTHVHNINFVCNAMNKQDETFGLGRNKGSNCKGNVLVLLVVLNREKRCSNILS